MLRGVLHSQAQREGDGKRRIQERETITGMKRGANGWGQTRDRRTERERETKPEILTDSPTGGQRFCYVLIRVKNTRGMSQASHISNCGGLHSTLRLGPRGDLLVTEQHSSSGGGFWGKNHELCVYVWVGWGWGISGKASASSVAAPDTSRVLSGPQFPLDVGSGRSL